MEKSRGDRAGQWRQGLSGLVVASLVLAACGLGGSERTEATPADVKRLLQQNTAPDECPLLDVDDVIAAYRNQPEAAEGNGRSPLTAEEGDEVFFRGTSVEADFGIYCQVAIRKKGQPRNDPDSPDFDPDVADYWVLMTLGIFFEPDGLDGDPDDVSRKIGQYTLAIDADDPPAPAVLAALADSLERNVAHD